jgi:hypothetical protein
MQLDEMEEVNTRTSTLDGAQMAKPFAHRAVSLQLLISADG